MKRTIPAVIGAAAAPDAGRSPVAAADDGQSTPNAPVTLTLAGWSLSTTPEFKTLADGFHATHPNVTVELKEYDAGQLRHPDDRRPGRRHSAPDIYVMKNLKNFYTYQSGGQLLDVSDVAAGLGATSGGTRRTRSTARRYAVPYRQDSWVLFYNKDLFDEGEGGATRTAAGPGTTTPTRRSELHTGLKAAGSTATAPTSTPGSRPCRASRSPRPPARTCSPGTTAT